MIELIIGLVVLIIILAVVVYFLARSVGSLKAKLSSAQEIIDTIDTVAKIQNTVDGLSDQEILNEAKKWEK